MLLNLRLLKNFSQLRRRLYLNVMRKLRARLGKICMVLVKITPGQSFQELSNTKMAEKAVNCIENFVFVLVL